MNPISIDQKKCNRDGICVDICPARVIERISPEAYPTPTEHFEELCIKCGHCLAVCPKGAFSLSFMTPDKCIPVRKEMLVKCR